MSRSPNKIGSSAAPLFHSTPAAVRERPVHSIVPVGAGRHPLAFDKRHLKPVMRTLFRRSSLAHIPSGGWMR